MQIKLYLKESTWSLTFKLSGTSAEKGTQPLNYVVIYNNDCRLFF